jgi:hypothetical protein
MIRFRSVRTCWQLCQPAWSMGNCPPY